MDRECGIPHASATGLMGFGDAGYWASAGCGAWAALRVGRAAHSWPARARWRYTRE